MKKYEQIFQIFYQLCRKALYHLYYRLSIDATILKHQLKHKCMLTHFLLTYISTGIPIRHICTVHTIDSSDTRESQRSKCPRVKDRL